MQEEAQEVPVEIIAKADGEAVRVFGDAVKQAGKASPEGQGNWPPRPLRILCSITTDLRTGLIGTPEFIARRIVEYKQAGVDLILSAFLHFQEEVEYFENVLVLVRQYEAEAGLDADEIGYWSTRSRSSARQGSGVCPLELGQRRKAGDVRASQIALRYKKEGRWWQQTGWMWKLPSGIMHALQQGLIQGQRNSLACLLWA